jgi:hypothetical protein
MRFAYFGGRWRLWGDGDWESIALTSEFIELPWIVFPVFPVFSI